MLCNFFEQCWIILFFVYLFCLASTVYACWTWTRLALSLFSSLLTLQYNLEFYMLLLYLLWRGSIYTGKWWLACIIRFLHFLYLSFDSLCAFFFSLISWPNLFMTAFELFLIFFEWTLGILTVSVFDTLDRKLRLNFSV